MSLEDAHTPAQDSPDAVNPDVRTWDALAGRLHEWRRAAGEPSFAEIAARIAEARQAAGHSPESARIGRSTVYDVFRPGRRRVNLVLVREIGDVLGVDGDHVDEAITRGRDATPAPPPASERTPGPDPGREASAAPQSATLRQVLVLMVACVAINLLGRAVVDLLGLPLYLDMVGTALAAIALGPWRGAAVGATTNIVGVATSGMVSLPFLIVNVAGALVWGYGVRRWRMARTLPRFLGLNVMVAVACSLIAVPILVLFYEGHMGHGQDLIADNVRLFADQFLVAIGVANLVTSGADKVISGFLALVGVSALPAVLRGQVELPLSPTTPREQA